MASPRFVVDRLWPDPAPDLALDSAFAELELPPAPTDRPLVGVNMVTSIDGRAQLRGTAEGLAGRADRRLMRLLRAGYDAVASGAGTLRAAGLWTWLPPDLARRRAERGQAPQPMAILFAGLGELDPRADWFQGDQPRLVVSGPLAPAARMDLPAGTELLIAPSDPPDPGWVLAWLAQQRVESVLLEGGPRLNAAFLALDLVDEVYWTIGAKLVGDEGLPMVSPITGGSPWATAPRDGRLVSVHRSGQDLFLRYRFV